MENHGIEMNISNPWFFRIIKQRILKSPEQKLTPVILYN